MQRKKDCLRLSALQSKLIIGFGKDFKRIPDSTPKYGFCSARHLKTPIPGIRATIHYRRHLYVYLRRNVYGSGLNSTRGGSTHGFGRILDGSQEHKVSRILIGFGTTDSPTRIGWISKLTNLISIEL